MGERMSLSGRLALAALILIAGTVLQVNAASAAPPPPDGSYRDSCRNIGTATVVGTNVLKAQCRDMSGRWRDTTLKLSDCRGDIYNDDGRLACAKGGGNDFSGLPGGSWQQSCRNAYRQSRNVVAECLNRNGRWIRTAIGINSCGNNPRLANIDGELQCENGNGWSKSTITLYARSDFSGDKMSTSQDISNLARYGFNDRTGSVRVSGGGEWELCRDSYYRGGCVTVRKDQRLSDSFKQEISSVRRVR
jgi:beta/gamma crystallin/CVNH domain-containing protein